MKKLLFIAAVAAIALTSCQQEKDIQGGTAGQNEFGFALQSDATRSAATVNSVEISEPVLVANLDGVDLFLEESVVDLYDCAPATRGVPVYTQNVGYLYRDKLGVYTDGAGGVDAAFSHLEGPTTEGKWIYQHRYTQDIWPDETSEVQFYLYMPTDMKSNGASLSFSGGTTTVSYTSPETAAAQQDIIFGGANMNHTTYLGHYGKQGGAPVTLYHALTGVKFAIANDAAEVVNIHVSKISFKGLQNTGTFTFDATNPSREAFEWTSATATTDNVIYQEFADDDVPVTYDATTHAGNNFAPSFFSAGTSQNLNNAEASYTFWLIPQKTKDNPAVLKIEYTINGNPEYMEINVKDLTTSNWQAGQLRTYTFKINEVNLMITDEVAIDGEADDGFEGSEKSNVQIKNTGNTNAFIRAAIVGQWLDENGDPVFGFTDEINNLYLVESWYEDQFVNGSHNHGEFVGLPGYGTTPNPSDNNWVWCEDGFYYYTKVVAKDGYTDPLFESYTVGTIPNSQIAGHNIPNSSMHFTLEISTQAIAANKLNGTAEDADWATTWKKALGEEPQPKQ